ncbi:hypothetical protein CAP36_08070 [Chitinophagaceae bacterium IBVUCB2]|nr:hypothetical protein CAP36_08070 [Chitinophagaceae bacterium IBVUCB2]
MTQSSFTAPGSSPIQVVPHSITDERIFSLDVLRGLALLGILVISIWEFGGFTNNQQIFYRTGTHGGNYNLLTAVSILFEGKMRALFALVFGAGIILFLQKKEHPVAINNADAYIRRQMWLMGFGIFNAFVLLWPGDILFQYGVVGILLFAFYGMKTRGIFICAILCMLIYCGKQYWNFADDKKTYKKYVAVTVVEKKFKADSLSRAKKDSIDKTKDSVLFKDTLLKNKLNDSLARKNDTLTKKQAEEKGAWEGLTKEMKYDSSKTEAENKSMRASYLKVWQHLMGRSQNKESFWLYRIGVWDIGSMMLWGMALFSLGFFSSRFASSKYLLIGLIALITGLALAWLRIKWGDDRLMDFTKFVEKSSLPHNLFFPVERLLMATGYASLLLWLLRMGIFNWLWKALAAAGKMAFTNYILQSVICTFFFYGYGFGYFGRLQQWELYFVVAEIALVQIVFSVFWLRYYTMGPLEWLWRCLIYRKRLPIKKNPSIND